MESTRKETKSVTERRNCKRNNRNRAVNTIFRQSLDVSPTEMQGRRRGSPEAHANRITCSFQRSKETERNTTEKGLKS